MRQALAATARRGRLGFATGEPIAYLALTHAVGFRVVAHGPLRGAIVPVDEP